MNPFFAAPVLIGFLWLGLGLGFVPPSHAENTLRWSTNYYSVTGSTVREIRQSIRANRPWKDRFSYDAFTDWRVNWRFNVAPSAEGCRYTSFSTQTSILITMPRWAAPTNATEVARQRWTEYRAALGKHEAAHAAIALAAAAELNKRAQAVGVATDCEQLKQQMEEMGRRVIEEFRARDKAYDEQTRHGATEGAVLHGPRGDRR